MTDTTAGADSSPRRTFLKIGAGVVGGLVVGGAAAYLAKPSTTATSTTTSTSTQTATSTLTSPTTVTSTLPGTTVTSTLPGTTVTSTETTTLPAETTTSTSTVTSTTTTTSTSVVSPPVAFQFLTTAEVPLVTALAEAMIPTDSNGPGANEAGVVYFIDGQLAGAYGNNANMYLEGPYVQPGLAGPITVNGITYSGGSAASRLTAGGGYQYPLKWQEFWRNCLAWTEQYANSAYGGNFESLSAANQASVLTDLWNQKPTNFGVNTQAWFSELHDMVWAGFFTDPLYGGNQGMVGWLLTGFTGTNQGNAYGEGYTSQQLMMSTKPIPLKPQSLAQFQQAVGGY